MPGRISNGIFIGAQSFPITLFSKSLRCFLTLLLLVLLPMFPLAARAQQPSPPAANERELGISLYKKGDTKAAIKQFSAAVKKAGDDWESWYYLGLARLRDNDLKNARKAFEKSAVLQPNSADVHAGWAYALMLAGKNSDAERESERAIALDSQNADAHYVLGVVRLRQRQDSEAETEADISIKLKPTMAAAYLLKSQALLSVFAVAAVVASSKSPSSRPPTEAELKRRPEAFRRRMEPLSKAATALETYLQLADSGSATEIWREQLKILKRYTGGDGDQGVFSSGEVSTKARVLAKPEPPYTEEARAAQVIGMVLLSAIFSADGKVENVLVLRSLPYGLTEKSIAAAKKIKFAPALKDGRPVSMFMLLEYNFNLY